jgi:hypothetical protein
MATTKNIPDIFLMLGHTQAKCAAPGAFICIAHPYNDIREVFFKLALKQNPVIRNFDVQYGKIKDHSLIVGIKRRCDKNNVLEAVILCMGSIAIDKSYAKNVWRWKGIHNSNKTGSNLCSNCTQCIPSQKNPPDPSLCRWLVALAAKSIAQCLSRWYR